MAGLLSDLLNGVIQAGEKLPNEDQIAQRFDVSLATVRGPVESSHLSRIHGSGMYGTAQTRAFAQRHAQLYQTSSR
ncbi:GntR family transcriptional regulator [Saccharopolyspora spinosa]|uniref:GntR family transcriptional regulator n=1 Tax=Saccharopolyspora spinosa TaxID=60894 RepID=UPI000A061B7F|nr:GntR family transcriptional regulator [Saccharopolyspora spinosa]